MILDRLIYHKHLEKGEKILYSVHKHWIEVAKPALEIGFFGFALPWTFFFVGFDSRPFFWIAVVWSGMAYLRFMYVLIYWYANTWLITNMNVITIEWKGIFSNIATRLGYEDIEGASYEIKGFWGSIFRYVNLVLRVMSGSHAKLENFSRPKKAELALARFKEQFLNDRNLKDANTLKRLLSNLVMYENRNR